MALSRPPLTSRPMVDGSPYRDNVDLESWTSTMEVGHRAAAGSWLVTVITALRHTETCAVPYPDHPHSRTRSPLR